MIKKGNPDKKEDAYGARGRPQAGDIYVGGRVRERRTMLGMSQEKLGEALGLTFQQIQKYERGTNRIGAGRLHHISEILGVPINYFFEEIPRSFGEKQEKSRLVNARTVCDNDPVANRETRELIRAYYGIKDPAVRRRLFDLARQIGKSFPDS